MNLSQIRSEINREIATNGTDSPRVTELIIERDRLVAMQPKPRELTATEIHEDMAHLMYN